MKLVFNLFVAALLLANTFGAEEDQFCAKVNQGDSKRSTITLSQEPERVEELLLQDWQRQD
jgi:hypothetical protein